MRKRNWIALLLTALLLTGCGKTAEPTTVPTTEAPTTEAPTTVPTEPPLDAKTVMDRMLDMAEEYPATEMDVKMVMDAEIDLVSMGMAVNMKMDISGHTVSSPDRSSYYMDMDINVNALGNAVSENMETYIVTEDGERIGYTYTKSTDAWTREEVPEEEEEASSLDGMEDTLREIPADQLELDDKTKIVNKTEVYVLNCTVPGDKINMEIADLEEMLGSGTMDMDDLDLSQIEIPLTLCVDVETFQLRYLKMDLAGMGDLMNSVITKMLGVTEGAADMEMEVNLTTFHVVEGNISYEEVEVPQLPEEAKERANTFSFYPIEEAEVELKVPCPMDYVYVEGDYYYAGFVNEDQTHLIYFSLYTDAEFTEYFGKGDAAGFSLPKDCVRYGAGPDIQGFKTLWGTDAEGTNSYFAWRQVGSCKLVVESYDILEESSLEVAMNTLLGAIDFPTETM